MVSAAPSQSRHPQTRNRSFIDPSRLYSLYSFHEHSGISTQRVRNARKKGVDLPVIRVGRRQFVRGHDAIAFIERLASL